MFLIHILHLLLHYLNFLPFITPYISPSPSPLSPLPSANSPPSPPYPFSFATTTFSGNPAMYCEYACLNNPSLHQALFELLSTSMPWQKPKALVIDFFYGSDKAHAC
ncbi:hypothetical protein NL676_016690 [Syzygium grande]|nr:hypothetical protein NL676_016690 [Syzygium grande]